MEGKGPFINAMPRLGIVTVPPVSREWELRPKRSGGFYLRLLLGDLTGEVEGSRVAPLAGCCKTDDF
jgi:hypothetical protein